MSEVLIKYKKRLVNQKCRVVNILGPLIQRNIENLNFTRKVRETSPEPKFRVMTR